MSILDSRKDRHLASDRIDRCKISISDMQLDIDRIFQALPLPALETMKRLAEIDVHLTRALEHLGEAQRQILNIS